MQGRYTNYFSEQMLADLIQASGGVAGILKGAKVWLFTAGPSLAGNMVLGDFTEATFNGYAAGKVAQVWSSVYLDQLGNVVMVGSANPFAATDAVITETVVAWGLVDGAGTHLLYAEYLDTPFAVSQPLQGITITPVVGPPQTGWSAGTIVA